MSLFVYFTSSTISEHAFTAFDKKHFYSVFACSDLNSINVEMKLVSSNPNQLAYEGALLMKKAGMVNNPKEKISLFKEGRTKLEYVIKSNSHTIEFLFLRYMIQENSPGFLGYNTNLEEDKKKIISNYNTFDTVIKEAIQNYSKTSKTLSSLQF